MSQVKRVFVSGDLFQTGIPTQAPKLVIYGIYMSFYSSGYLPFLDSLQNQIHVLSAQQSLASTSPQLPESQTVSTPVGDEQPDVGIVGTESLNSRHGSSSEGGATEDNNSSMCILS